MTRIFAVVTSIAVITAGASGMDIDTSGNCSPVISDVDNQVTINCVFLATSEQRFDQAVKNIDYVINSFQSIGFSNTALLEPSLQRYAEHPSPQAWATIVDYANMSLELVKAAVLSVIVSQPSMKAEMGPHLQALLNLADEKSNLLHQLVGWEHPPTEGQALEWALDYQDTIIPLWLELKQIREELEHNPPDRPSTGAPPPTPGPA